jgi:membrane protein implicated in regulation of membrane protease activity
VVDRRRRRRRGRARHRDLLPAHDRARPRRRRPRRPLGSTQPIQLLVAAVVGGGATALWHWRRVSSAGPALPTAEDRDVNLDIGERVNVPAWASDGTARVSYRGSTWAARLQPGAPAVPGEHVVAAVEGNWLVLAPRLASH